MTDPAILAATRSAGAVVLYMTGLGATDPPLREGVAAPASPLTQTLLQPTVLAGGQAAPVFFSGLAPGLVGVYQVNASIPADAPATLEIVVEAGGRRSKMFSFNQVGPTAKER